MPYAEYITSEDTVTKVYYVDNISEAHQSVIDKFQNFLLLILIIFHLILFMLKVNLDMNLVIMVLID